MKRSQILLSVLGAVLVVALFYVALFQPSREELATIEASIVTEQTAQQGLNVEISRLRAVREEAPEIEAGLAAAEAIVPRDPALPSTLRQLQLSADESGVVLQSVVTSRPILIDDAADGLSAIDVNVQMSGGYFQVVDFLRRVEDPTITPRGLDWNSATVVRDNANYPDLQVSLTGRVYAFISVPPPPETEQVLDEGDAIEGEDGDVAEGTELEVDIDAEDAS